jgi:hypothetical protein
VFRLKTLASRSLSWQLILLCGLSVSIAWGIRGQFGHEYGAALAGALGGIVAGLGFTVASLQVKAAKVTL